MRSWVNEWFNQWISESMSHWTNEPMNQLITEPVTKQMNEWMNWRMGGWVSYLSLLSYFFTERLLRWGASSFGYFFSVQPLIWAASALSCLPASPPVASAIQFFFFAQLLQCASQPPVAIPRARSVAASLMLCYAQPCQCVLSQPVANPRSRSAAPNRPMFAQRWQWGLDRTIPGLLRTHHSFIYYVFFSYVKPSFRYSRAHFADLIFQKRSVHFTLLTFWSSSRARATVETETQLR